MKGSEWRNGAAGNLVVGRSRRRSGARDGLTLAGLLVLLGSLGGFGGGGQGTDSEGHLWARSVSDVVAHSSVMQSRSFPLDLVLRSRLEGEELGVSSVGAIVADESGTLYILDTMAREIVGVTEAGEVVGRWGGSGEGPGEFSSAPSWTLVWRGDTLLALDGFPRRVIRVVPGGSYVGTEALPFEMTRLDRLVANGQNVYGIVVDSGNPVRVRWVEFHREEGPTWLPQLADTVPGVRGMSCRSPNLRDFYSVSVPLVHPWPLTAVQPTGDLVMAGRREFRIERVDPRTGRTRLLFARDWSPGPLNEAQWEALPEIQQLRRLESGEYGGGEGRLVKNDPSEAFDPNVPCPLYEMRPEMAPPIRTIITDGEGRMWVETMPLGADGRLGLLVLGPEGDVLGEGAFPERDARVTPYVRNDRVYLATVDELDVQAIEVYEMR